MLAPRSIAVVGASPRPGSFGERMATEVARSAAAVHFVNPGYDEIAGRPCHASLDQLPEPVDLVLLGVGDASLEAELKRAAARGDRSAVIFGNAYEPVVDGVPSLRQRLASTAREAGMALCGGGCMGFVNLVAGIRAIGYVEPDPLPAGPVGLVTHSGSVFSAMLRARRGIGYTVAVSSGQELVTTTAAYLDYALSLPQTEVLALVVETMRDADALRASLAAAASRDMPVVVLPVGTSERGRSMVAAHSGAIAGGTAAWEALADAYGLHLVGDLGELLDTVELFAAGRRARIASGPLVRPAGLGAVLDSGAERALLVDVADAVGAPFAELSAGTITALSDRLDPGLVATNPLDVWGNGADTEELFGDVLVALAADPAVRALALAVDLVHELDGDTSYLRAVERAAATTDLPVVVLSHLPSALDPEGAQTLRAAGIPVLEGTRSSLLALRHLLDHADRPTPRDESSGRAVRNDERRDRWRARIATGEPMSTEQAVELLADYGITSAQTRSCDQEAMLLTAAGEIGYPVVLKTDEAVAHKTDVGGVVVGIGFPAELGAAYRELAGRLGPRAVVCEQVAPGTEVMLGAVRDPNLGMLLVIGAGGTLVEQLPGRVAALPPVRVSHARQLLDRAAVGRLLSSPRHGPPTDLDAVAAAITAFSKMVADLGDVLEAIEVNPLICSPSGAVALDVHLEPRFS
jgi:acyl-CoA synthetase (NDP forming)